MEKGSREVIEAWDLLREAGPQACSTANEVVAVMSPLRRPLNFRDVAGCLTLFSRTWGESGRFGGPPNPSASLMLGNKRSVSNVGGWNLDAFVDAVPKSVNWDMVIRALDDFADLKVKSQDVFANVIVHTYKRATKQGFVPGTCFLGADWRNADVQAALLMHALKSEDVRFEPTVEGGSDTKWSCVMLVETLLRLAEKGHQAMSHAALQLGRATDPDSLLLSLLWSNPQWEQLREELYAALVPALLTRALEEDAEAIRVLASVWSLNRELVIRGVLDVLTRDASVLNLIIRLPDGLASLLRLPLRFSLAAACAAANADPMFRLDNWLTERLSTLNPEMLPGSVRDILTFIETRQQGAPSQARPRLSRGCLTALLRVLQACRAPDVMPDIRRILEQYNGEMEAAPAPNGGGQGYEDIEEQANATFKLIYSGSLEMDQVITMLSRLKDSEDAREQSIFTCMVNNLFDEYRFFHNYPEKELHITAVLFGNLIQHQLLSSWSLNMAIRYVLDALRRAPTTPEETKIFRFGMIALEQFKSRLGHMPHVVADLLAIAHLATAEPQLYADIERANASGVSPGNAPASPSQIALGLGGLSLTGGSLPLSMVEALEMKRATSSTDSDANAGSGASLPLRGTESPEVYAVLCRKLDTLIGGLQNEEPPPSPGVDFEDQIQFLINNLTLQNLEEKIAQARNVIHQDTYAWTAYYLVSGRISTQQNFHGLYMQFLDGLGRKQLMFELRQRTLAQVRKLVKSNRIVTSTAERSVLKNLGSWLGQLTLAKNKPLLHREVDLKELLFDGYERGWLIAILPFVAKVLEGAQNSRIFTATNPWMAGILSALAEIYNLSEVKLNLKFETEVLFRLFAIFDLQAVTPSNILQTRIKPKLAQNPDFNSKSSAAPATASAQGSNANSGATAIPSIFMPQGGMAPAQQQPTGAPQPLHLSQLGFPPQNSGAFQQQQGQPFGMYAGEEARTSASRAPGPQPSLPAQQQAQMGLPGMGAGAVQATGEKLPIPTETQFIPNLASYVFVNSQLGLFQKHPELKRVVPIAVDRALHDILQPAVERSVSIATITTRELILKDFAMEPDESKMMKAAHLMATSLAGSMALVTCKEHLRIAMGNNLRQLLTSQGLSAEEMVLVDQVVQTSSTENLDLGCLLIEKAAANKALQEIDDALEHACTARREHRETTGQPYYDTAVLNNGMRYPSNLPPGLRPRPTDGGLSLEQLAVYEAFQRPQRPSAAASARDAALPPGAAEMGMHQLQGGSGAPLGAPGVPRMLNSNQALEKYKAVVAALDQAVQKLLQQPGFHEMPASTLPPDHDIILQLHNVRSIVAATLPEVRFDVAVVLAQSVFKRLYDGPVTDKLRLSVQVGVLEAVSSALDGVQLRAKITEWVVFSIINGKLNVAVTAALVDTHLVGGPELDGLLADLLESQLSSAAVAFASDLVQRCVVQSRRWLVADASRTLGVLRTIAMGATAIPAPPGLARLLNDVADIAAAQQQAAFKAGGGVAPPGQMALPSELSAPVQPTQPFVFSRNTAIDSQARKDVEGALQRWLAVSRDGVSVTQFLAGLHDKGLLRGDQNMERFFYLCTELCVESFLTIVAQPIAAEPNASAPSLEAEMAKSRLAYTGVDSYSLLVTLLVKLADHRVRPTIAAQALEACAKVMAYEVSTRFAQGHEAGFDQRPYFRLLLNFQRELLSIPGAAAAATTTTTNNATANGVPPANEAELNESADKLLAVFAEAHHHYFSPEHAPGFCFAWLELISHHSFMPKLLKEERGWGVLHRLLVDLFAFMEPYLKTVQLTNAVRMLYRGTLRVLLVLLHDFPEFLCFFHFSLCNVIPPTCVQLRNLILSAFPRTMRLPDPFTPNLKVDLLPEIAVHPRILADYTALLEQTPGGNLRVDIDSYLRTLTQPANFLATLKDRLRAGGNWHVLNALVLHVGVSAITWSKIAETGSSQQETAGAQTYMQGSRNIFHTLATDLDAEARYHFLNAIANHLRYPNSHTHYFSCVILGLFKEGSEVVQEQVTRVLLERLIVHRPHPWGLLVTFIELMKNPRYAFWDHSFTRCTQEIHKVFESVASSCGASQQAASTMT